MNIEEQLKRIIKDKRVAIVGPADYVNKELDSTHGEYIDNSFDEAEKKGLGVVALGSKMIDPPVVKRALQTIDLAITMELLTERWKK